MFHHRMEDPARRLCELGSGGTDEQLLSRSSPKCFPEGERATEIPSE